MPVLLVKVRLNIEMALFEPGIPLPRGLSKAHYNEAAPRACIYQYIVYDAAAGKKINRSPRRGVLTREEILNAAASGIKYVVRRRLQGKNAPAATA